MYEEYMEKLLNVENDWNGEMDCPEVMGPCCLISEEEVAAAIKGVKMGKAAGPTGMVMEMIKVLSKKAVFLMIGERVSWYMCTRGNVIHLCVGHTELLSYWSSR